MVNVIVFNNGDKLYTLCGVFESVGGLTYLLFNGVQIDNHFFDSKDIAAIIPRQYDESLSWLSYPLESFIYQQYDPEGKLTFVWPTMPLEKPIGEHHGKSGIHNSYSERSMK